MRKDRLAHFRKKLEEKHRQLVEEVGKTVLYGKGPEDDSIKDLGDQATRAYDREFLFERTTSEGADFGVAFDGDADRCFFVDDEGAFVPGVFVNALLAESVLEKSPGGKIIYDVRASWAVPETLVGASHQ